MRILSWNVNGIRAVMKKGFHEFVGLENPDILCLQETKAQQADFEDEIRKLPDYHFYCYSASKKGYSGTAVLAKPEPENVIFDMETEGHVNEGRVITLEYPGYFLTNVYVPNSGRELARLDYQEKWGRDFRNFISGLLKKKPVIITGDLNVAHEPIDLARPKSNYNKTAGFTQREIDDFEKLLKLGFKDTFRTLYPEEVRYSYWSYMFGARKKNIGWRIDYFLVSEGLMENVNNAIILNDIMGSDHCPVCLDIRI